MSRAHAHAGGRRRDREVNSSTGERYRGRAIGRIAAESEGGRAGSGRVWKEHHLSGATRAGRYSRTADAIAGQEEEIRIAADKLAVDVQRRTARIADRNSLSYAFSANR